MSLRNLIDLIHCKGKIQIETDQRLDIGVDRLAADHAEAYSVSLEAIRRASSRRSDLSRVTAFQNDSAFIARVCSPASERTLLLSTLVVVHHR